MATLKSTTLNSGTSDTTLTISDHSSAPSPSANKLHANTTSIYWEAGDLTGGGGETITKKVGQQLANTTGLLDMTESACTAVNLVVTANTTLDGVYFSKHTIAGTSRFGGLLIHSDIANTSTSFSDSSITGHTVVVNGQCAHRTTRDHPFKYPKTTANTAIFFDGTGDYLTIVNHEDLEFGFSDWTVDFWFYHDTADTLQSLIGKTKNDTALYGGWFIRITAANKMEFGVSSADNAWTVNLVGGTTVTTDTWNHVALTRQGDTVRLFLNGTLEEEGTTSEIIYKNGNSIYFGTLIISDSASNYFNGFMDEIRIINGYAAYTSNFSVPTRPYSGHEFAFSVDTKAKYCGQGTNQTSSDVGAAVRMGNDSTGSGAAKVSIGDAFNVNSISYSIPLLFENSASGHNHIHYNVWTEVWGNTELEDADTNPVVFGNEPIGTRGIYGGGWNPGNSLVDIIEYITIGSTGEATDFGNLTTATTTPGGASNGTRGVFAGGYIGTSPAPTATNVIEYITIGSTGNATDFGDYTILVELLAGVSNGYRGLFAGGESGPASTLSTDTSNYVEIATTGNGVEYGNLSLPRTYLASMSNFSRGVFAGGVSSAARFNTIDYFTISSSANAIDFGDTVVKKSVVGGTSDGSRGVIGGGNADPGNTNQGDIEYIAIGTTGNATDWGGELSQARRESAASSNGSRGVWAGGYVSAATDTIDYITIGVSGVDATDFGNLTAGQYGMQGFSGT